jgi:hypothetical protein
MHLRLSLSGVLTNLCREQIMKFGKLLFLLIILFASCRGQNHCPCDSLGEPLTVFLPKNLALNKTIIPDLIDCMDIDKKSWVGFKPPFSSYLESYHINQCGISYAYVIDYILTKDSIESVNKTWGEDRDILHWEEIIKPYRIYSIGVIVRQDEHENLILKPLAHDDMVNIKKMYAAWWNENKDKPIETLRKEFRSGNKILKLPYVWM